MSNHIKVVCRFRPPNSLELREGGDIVVQIDDEGTNVKLKSQEAMKGPEAGGFTFDRVFGMETKQVSVFEYGVKGIVDDVINGYNGTVFAYGQTGSGKTFTMMGADIDDEQLKGLIPRITEQIFDAIMTCPPNIEFLVKVGYMELYQERIRDLMAPQNDNLQVHEDKTHGVYVKGLSDYYVSSAHEVHEIMRQGGMNRVTSSTNMNAESSRSHSIFVVTVQQRNVETGTAKNGNLYLVDLAGSEKVGKTGASGQTLEEAKKINKSLSALGMVINALTDGKSTHIPYRDSKLTRILQESLGGNSRTTLIINCSPVVYNELETLSTLRFGMRAKSIKNKARINAELSPTELKALLKKAQRDVSSYQSYVALLEAELATWRSGGKVDKADWATSEKAAATPLSTASVDGATSPTNSRASPNLPSRPFTPSNPALDAIRELDDSRPQSPSVGVLEKDEREDFLRRENELSDHLAEKEAAFTSQEKLLQELRDELAFIKEQEGTMNKDNKTLTTELNDHRLQLERLSYENKESVIVMDAVKEQNAELSAEIEELRKSLAEAKSAQRGMSQEGKERKKAEKMAALLGTLETSAASEKEEQIRATLNKLDAAVEAAQPLSADDMALLRRQLTDSQTAVAEQQERLRVAADETELAARRRDELEARLLGLEQEYEELLDKTLRDEEAGNAHLADTVQDIKAKLDAQHAAKRDTALTEMAELRQQIDVKQHENRTLAVQVESLKGANEELKRAFAVTAAGIEGGKDLAESAKDMERIRKTMSSQLADFDTMKKALMKDLQDRCEKVVELEISLDETREQYNNVLRNSNSKAQQRKMDFLSRNLEQLTLVQRQLVEQNSALKKDVVIAERKLMSRNERIGNLETMLTDAQERLDASEASFEKQIQSVRDRLDQSRAAKQLPANSIAASFGRIAKPLRGGGVVEQVSRPPVAHSTPKTADKRSSWFFNASPAS